MDKINEFLKKNDKIIVMSLGIGMMVCVLVFYIGYSVETRFSASYLTGLMMMGAMVSAVIYGVWTSKKEVTLVGLVIYSSFIFVESWSGWVSDFQNLSNDYYSAAYKTMMVFEALKCMCVVAFGILVIIEYFKKKTMFTLPKEILFLTVLGLTFIIFIIDIVVVAQGNSFWSTIFSYFEGVLLIGFLYTGYLNYIAPKEEDVVRVFDEDGNNTIEMEAHKDV